MPHRQLMPLLPQLEPGSGEMLPHVKAVGELVAGAGYFVRQKASSPKYMQLYIGRSTDSDGYETSGAPQELGSLYSEPGMGVHPYLVELTLDGGGLIDYQNETYAISAGEFIFIDCFNAHYYRTDPAVGNWHKLWIYVSGPCVGYFYRTFQKANRRSCRGSVDRDSRMADIIRDIHALYAEPGRVQFADMQASALVIELLSECVRGCACAKERRVPDVIWMVQEYLDQNYTATIKLDQLAARFALDKYYLQKLFTQHVGISPNEYLIGIRMQKARELLCTTPLTVEEVANRVGIENTSYFIKQFKHRESVTPSKYRQLMQTMTVNAKEMQKTSREDNA